MPSRRPSGRSAGPTGWRSGCRTGRTFRSVADFPFGGGPRLCIGQPFALLEAQLILATIAQPYKLALLPDHPVIPEPSLTLRPKYGLRMRLEARQSGAPDVPNRQAPAAEGLG